MTRTLELGEISTEFFLQNISNLQSINVSFSMIEIEYAGYQDNRQIINQTKVQFLIFCKKITNEISAMCAKNKIYQPAFDYEELLLVSKLINSLDLSFSKLLQFTKEKIDDMIIFVLSIEKNATSIDFSEEEKEKIRQEIFISRERLKI